ncbi:MAG: hypothetical protein IJS32_08310 [Kiritimatiellae bacterium]|nr:hypothetical protein [Kiritimatiellia bacterium]
MKKTSLLLSAASFAAAFLLGACGWDGSGKDDSWSDVAINVSGSYHGTEGYGGAAVKGLSGRTVTYLSVQQKGTAITITDNLGGRYTGKISSTHKTAKGSGSSSVVQYALNYEASGTDYQGQATRLVGTFEAVAEGQLLHDRVMSGSWIGSAKTGTIYGLAASVTDSQLVNSGVTGSGSGGSSTNGNTNTPVNPTNGTSTLRWVLTGNREAQAMTLTITKNTEYTFRITGGKAPYTWKRTGVGSLENGSSKSLQRKFRSGSKTGSATLTVTDSNSTKITAAITVIDY